ncbi:PREDICTED: keratin-associated protein 15-1-like [Condylura cristata]|uniref:keratin-associated protein 15-1-like n=1 Tax=Condylura cristata TaxID=143302 RepID=UPI0003344D3A|nr:PREDICTED: keratin-associated protein 15-1-like [Condylura cristata]
MSYNYGSGNFSSRSFGGYLGYPGSTCESFCPNNVAYSPNNCQPGSSFYGGCQENFLEASGCQNPCAGTRTFPASCLRPKNNMFYNQMNQAVSQGCGNAGFGPFGYGCGAGFQPQGSGAGFCRPNYLSNRSCQSTCYQPGVGSRFYGSTY